MEDPDAAAKYAAFLINKVLYLWNENTVNTETTISQNTLISIALTLQYLSLFVKINASSPPFALALSHWLTTRNEAKEDQFIDHILMYYIKSASDPKMLIPQSVTDYFEYSSGPSFVTDKYPDVEPYCIII